MAKKKLTDWNNTQRVLEEFGQRLIDTYKRELGSRGKIASGKLVEDLRYDVKTGDWHASVTLHLADYWKYVEHGRRAGKFPPIDAIRKWIEVKPILPRPNSNGRLPTTNQLVYLIGRKIAQKGIPPTPALALSVEGVYQQMLVAISNALSKDLGERVAQVFTYDGSFIE
ncbi:MAG: hypothetical protein IKK89_04660 [Alistipes sp.]|nr:hypothetical protein [Alistipes sp.]MBR6631218.1 hypothetical protein [Alistipes sp.]